MNKKISTLTLTPLLLFALAAPAAAAPASAPLASSRACTEGARAYSAEVSRIADSARKLLKNDYKFNLQVAVETARSNAATKEEEPAAVAAAKKQFKADYKTQMRFWASWKKQKQAKVKTAKQECRANNGVWKDPEPIL